MIFDLLRVLIPSSGDSAHRPTQNHPKSYETTKNHWKLHKTPQNNYWKHKNLLSLKRQELFDFH